MEAVELASEAQDNGLAIMMVTMMNQNLADHPERLDILARLRGRISILAEDANVTLTMHFSNRRAVIYDGIVGIPDVTLRGEFEVIANLARMEKGHFGLPDPKGEVNRSLIRAFREGRLKIYGILRGLPLLARLGALLAVD